MKGLGENVICCVIPLGVGLPLFVLFRVLDGLPCRQNGLVREPIRGHMCVWIEVCEGDVLEKVRGDAVELEVQARVIRLVLLSSLLGCLWWFVLMR